MTYDSKVERNELFFATATVAAHASGPTDGFRQRDVRFLIELFSNWVESALDGYVLEVQNTQVQRYITGLVEEGYARKISRKGNPHYRLTRIGLVELLSRLVERSYLSQRNQFFFLYYFVNNYGSILFELVKSEGSQFPIALKMEIDSLLDTKTLLRKEIKSAETELERLEIRVRDAVRTSALTRKALKDGQPFEEIVEEIERSYPYELNSQKPLTELISGIAPGMQQWELTTGTVRRKEDIWTPNRALLKAYIQELKKLLETEQY